MPKSAADYSRQILSQLKILIPDLSADPETPERKIIDTVAEILAEASVDPYLLNYQFDIDTKVGTDLDKFVALFGFARQGGRRATGSATFTRNSTSIDDVVIPAGTTIVKPATSISSTVTFSTSTIGILPAGATSVEIPIQCTSEGPLGNVPASTIISITGGGASAISGVINQNATSGGTDTESDAELRIRFKNTIFRNIAGTEDQFLALAIATRFSSKANVIGPVSRFREYVQVPESLSITSIIPYSKYTYPFDYYLTTGDSSTETFYNPGVDYTFLATVPPSINVNNTTNLPVGTVTLLEHTYCSTNSRNDPVNNIANYIDVFVNGEDVTVATETLAFPDSTFNFTSTSGAYSVGRYLRSDTLVTPIVNNRFQMLLWQPVLSLPDVIIINGVEYFQGTDFWLVKDVTEYKGSKRARDGIEWGTSVTSHVSVGDTFTISYNFNKIAIILNELMDRHKQITSDVLVHTANNRYFNLNLIIMYSPGFSRGSVDTALASSLTAFMERQQFGTLIQISDLIEVSHEVPGVDNVRLALPGDGVAYGVQEVAADGTTILGAPITSDFSLQDSDLPVLNSVATTQRSQNTWTS